MSDETKKPGPDQTSSFEEFKDIILKRGTDSDFLNKAAKLYNGVPRAIRILNNLDPTGASSAMNELLNDITTERERDNILYAIYELAVKISGTERSALSILPDDKFRFLYFVYAESETDTISRVQADKIQELLGLSQHRTISIGQYLDQNGFIQFGTWVEGIKIVHKGILKVETTLLENNELPEYVSENEIKRVEERVRLRFTLLKYLYKETEGDTFKLVLHAELAEALGLEHRRVVSQFIPYMIDEHWIRWRTADSVSIAEEGIDRV